MLSSSIRACISALTFTCIFAMPVQAAATWPERPITLVVPFGAGGITDLTARTVAKQLQAELGQSVVVENKPGAGGSIAATSVARAAPDGYTLMVITNGIVAVNPILQSSLNYDAMKDFAYISMISSTPLAVVVPPNSPLQNLADLVEKARSQPEALSFASSGQGTSIHQVFALLQKETDTSFLHIPYKSGAEAVTALLSGSVDVSAVETVVVGPFIQSGKMRSLGVTSSRKVDSLPALPTVESNLNVMFDVGSISGLVAPVGMPTDVIKKLERAMEKVVNSPDMQQLFVQGSQPMPVGSNAFHERMRQEKDKWRQVIRAENKK